MPVTNYKYRVYVTDSRSVDVVFGAISPSEGQLMVEAQYAGKRVIYIGHA